MVGSDSPRSKQSSLLHLREVIAQTIERPATGRFWSRANPKVVIGYFAKFTKTLLRNRGLRWGSSRRPNFATVSLGGIYAVRGIGGKPFKEKLIRRRSKISANHTPSSSGFKKLLGFIWRWGRRLPLRLRDSWRRWWQFSCALGNGGRLRCLRRRRRGFRRVCAGSATASRRSRLGCVAMP